MGSGIVALSIPCTWAQRPLMADTFERSRGDFTAALSKHDRLEVVRKAGTQASKAIEATYQGNERGSERIVVSVPCDRAALEYTLCYDVKFAADFDFAKGGKLPGLGPEKPVTGGKPMRADGWSARLMWREDGKIISYVYHQDQPGRYGDSKAAARVKFARGAYHAVTLQVTVNSAGDKADGRVAVYLDGRKLIEHRKLCLRGTDGNEALIERVLFSTFFGGSSPDWAPRDRDGQFSVEKAWFDNVAVYRGRVIRKKPASQVTAGE